MILLLTTTGMRIGGMANIKIQYISKLSLAVSIMIPIYVFATIIYPYSYIDYLLPTVNLLVWY